MFMLDNVFPPLSFPFPLNFFSLFPILHSCRSLFQIKLLQSLSLSHSPSSRSLHLRCHPFHLWFLAIVGSLCYPYHAKCTKDNFNLEPLRHLGRGLLTHSFSFAYGSDLLSEAVGASPAFLPSFLCLFLSNLPRGGVFFPDGNWGSQTYV